MVHFGNQRDLISRLAFALEEDTPRPLAFLTGAGLSLPAVPGVVETLNLVRESFSKDEQIELDELLSKHKELGEKYRQAFQFLGLRRPPAAAERLLKIATLRAFDRTGLEVGDLLARASEFEAAIDKWTLPAGQASLGRIIAGLPPRLRGPILTTNFDPLTEISIRKAGGVATPHVHVDDSSFISNLRVQPGASVIHLHGYWRDSQVLNTSEQLLLNRPSLAASLRVILEEHTLVVLGYGGWSDVISRALLEAIRQQRSGDLDVLWCLFKEERDLVDPVSGESTLAQFSDAPGNLNFYAGIDANLALPALEKRIADLLEYENTPPPKNTGLGLLGWNTLTAKGLSEVQANATLDAALTFFDGRLPSWHDAISQHIPIRTLTLEVNEAILNSQAKAASSMTLITGPSGEGKTMIGMQVAALAARREDPGFRVFVLEGDSFGNVDSIIRLPETAPCLLVVDEAHRYVSQLQDLAKTLQKSGRRGLHVLMISGDTDWLASGGSYFAWNRFVPTTEHTLQGINTIDAGTMVQAWERIGDEALGELSTLETTQARVDALCDSSYGWGVAGNGTLLGALLTTRYDREGLRQHLRELLERLRTRIIPGAGTSSLLDVVIAIAVPHAYGIHALNDSVLAAAFELSVVELSAYVLLPLGEEAAITYASGHIVMRHEIIASAVVDISLEMGIDISTVSAKVVRSAAMRVLTGRYDEDLVQLCYLASRTTDIPKLAIAAADAAVTAAPRRLSYRTTRSKVLRSARRYYDAAKENESSLQLIFEADNLGQSRGFFIEWGVVEGLEGNHARNAVLAGVALQDGVALGRLNVEQAERSLSCILLALRKMIEFNPEDRLMSALAAATVFARILYPRRNEGRAWLRAAERVVDKSGFTYPTLDGNESAGKLLRLGLLGCLDKLERPFPASFPRADFQLSHLQVLAS